MENIAELELPLLRYQTKVMIKGLYIVQLFGNQESHLVTSQLTIMYTYYLISSHENDFASVDEIFKVCSSCNKQVNWQLLI